MTIPPPNPSNCTAIGEVVNWKGVDVECTIEGTLYGYAPSLGANAFFAAFFGLCLIVQLVQGIRYKTWTYMIALCLGCIGEGVGYAGRVIMYNDPFADAGFMSQICCLIISPAFIAAGIYITLKHVVINFGESWSRLRPAWYTYIFICGDLISLVLQGAGGGLASAGDPGSSTQDLGTNLMIAGVIFQVVVLIFFGYFLAEYAIRTHRRRDQLSFESMQLFNSRAFRCFMFAIATAYLVILIRCVYRIPELSGGWRSELMRNEIEFIILEGAMIVIAVGVLTVFHPGYCFPALGNTIGKNKKAARGKSMDDGSDMEMVAGR
ncbi:RTA1 like protein-domain-containing protein [Boeremia exigua]|uniref:RTA1 like protein-domain-containing protein n=1 Tax=Boeremia exigua TaxID=749465 RepID=UPI001E8D753B|nr:RTA1 like protein-domain-containing protein [Boeremia exigua]KAH6629091.1 RTA1 like protein-domain-containing protein [Boeremia exigua]